MSNPEGDAADTSNNDDIKETESQDDLMNHQARDRTIPDASDQDRLKSEDEAKDDGGDNKDQPSTSTPVDILMQEAQIAADRQSNEIHGSNSINNENTTETPIQVPNNTQSTPTLQATDTQSQNQDTANEDEDIDIEMNGTSDQNDSNSRANSTQDTQTQLNDENVSEKENSISDFEAQSHLRWGIIQQTLPMYNQDVISITKDKYKSVLQQMVKHKLRAPYQWYTLLIYVRSLFKHNYKCFKKVLESQNDLVSVILINMLKPEYFDPQFMDKQPKVTDQDKADLIQYLQSTDKQFKDSTKEKFQAKIHQFKVSHKEKLTRDDRSKYKAHVSMAYSYIKKTVLPRQRRSYMQDFLHIQKLKRKHGESTDEPQKKKQKLSNIRETQNTQNRSSKDNGNENEKSSENDATNQKHANTQEVTPTTQAFIAEDPSDPDDSDHDSDDSKISDSSSDDSDQISTTVSETSNESLESNISKLTHITEDAMRAQRRLDRAKRKNDKLYRKMKRFKREAKNARKQKTKEEKLDELIEMENMKSVIKHMNNTKHRFNGPKLNKQSKVSIMNVRIAIEDYFKQFKSETENEKVRLLHETSIIRNVISFYTQTADFDKAKLKANGEPETFEEFYTWFDIEFDLASCIEPFYNMCQPGVYKISDTDTLKTIIPTYEVVKEKHKRAMKHASPAQILAFTFDDKDPNVISPHVCTIISAVSKAVRRQIIEYINRRNEGEKKIPKNLEELQVILEEIYYCNDATKAINGCVKDYSKKSQFTDPTLTGKRVASSTNYLSVNYLSPSRRIAQRREYDRANRARDKTRPVRPYTRPNNSRKPPTRTPTRPQRDDWHSKNDEYFYRAKGKCADSRCGKRGHEKKHHNFLFRNRKHLIAKFVARQNAEFTRRNKDRQVNAASQARSKSHGRGNGKGGGKGKGNGKGKNKGNSDVSIKSGTQQAKDALALQQAAAEAKLQREARTAAMRNAATQG